LFATFLVGAAQAEKRVALVIGNGDYRNVPALPNPPNDANDIANTLTRLGFAVRRVSNARYDDMRRALLAFGREARTADIAVVFYAGHGIEVGGENWLIPTDAELRTDIDVDQETIGLKSVLLTVENASKLGLVILDACRNNPFVAKMTQSIRTRAVARGLVGIEPNGNVLVAYAAKDGTTASDGDGRNSPFTAALLKHLETPGLEINFLFRNVRDEVMTMTKRGQQPFIYGSLSRERIFLKASLPQPVIALPPPPPPGPKPDELAWALIKDTKDVSALQRFSQQFPASQRRPEAEKRVAALNTAAAVIAAEEAARLSAAQKAGAREISRALQFELKRVGCYDGVVDGEFGDGSRNALRNFARLAAVNIKADDLSRDMLEVIRRYDKRVCPLTCRAGERADGERCVRIACPAGQIIKDGSCVAVRASAPKARTEPPPPTPRPPVNSKCFSFNGRQFCE
jgi:uncharacterized caspase-like protein